MFMENNGFDAVNNANALQRVATGGCARARGSMLVPRKNGRIKFLRVRGCNKM